MKHCPNCKANYNDDSLSFCLNDGTALLNLPDEQETQVIAKGRITNQPNFSNLNPNIYNQPAPSSNNKIVFLLFAVAGLILLIAIGGIAAYFLMPQKEEPKAQTSPTQTPKAIDKELKEKIANLEKQLQDQKKTPVPTATPTETSTPLNESGKATARVAQSGDGFLALRSEPSTKIGRRLLEIPSGATVEIEDCQNTYQTINGRRGRWCRVSYNNSVGWAFDAWLIY